MTSNADVRNAALSVSLDGNVRFSIDSYEMIISKITL